MINNWYRMSRVVGVACHKVILDEHKNPVDYEFLEVNDHFQQITGLFKDQILHKPVTEVLPGITEDSFDWINYYGQIALSMGEAVFEQYSYPLKKWYRVYVYSPQKEYFITEFLDITSEKILVNSAQQFNQYDLTTIDYKSILHSLCEISGAHYGVMNVRNEDDSFVTVASFGLGKNLAKLSDLLGFSLVGKKWDADAVRDAKIHEKKITMFAELSALVGTVLPKAICNNIQAMFHLSAISIVKAEKDGRILGDFTLFFNAGGELHNSGLVEIYGDMTAMLLDRLRYIQSLDQEREKRDMVLSVVSHDLRGPFGSFHNLLRFVLDSEESFKPEELKKLIIELDKATSSMYNLLSDVLSWAEVNKKGIAAQIKDEVNLKSTVQLVCENLKLLLVEKDISIDETIEAKAYIIFNREAFKGVVRNILSNAIKFSFPNSKIHISSQSEKGRTVLIVRDHGLGISKDVLEKIQRNVRVSQFGTKDEKGTGLGLGFCRDILTKNNAEMQIVSREGKGTKVRLVF